MYTIKHAAETTGVPAATLRAWERRYGLGQPTRTESGYRLYDERAIADIRAMQLLLEAGWAPRQAAAEVIRLAGNVGPLLTPTHAVAPDRAPMPADHVEAFVSAAASMHEHGMRQVLDEGFGRASFETAFDTWLAPALRALGAAWVEGRIDVAAEHFASAAVMRRLSSAYESAALVQGAPRVLVGLAPGAYHELGALAFAAAARRAGLAAVYVGANLPIDAWLAAVAQEPTAAVALSVVSADELASVQLLVQRLLAEHPALVVSVGGPQAPNVSEATVATDAGIAESVQLLLGTLRTAPAGRKSR